MRRLGLLVVFQLVLASGAMAQRLWLPPGATPNIGFEIAKGFYKSTDFGTNLDFASFAMTLQGRFPVGDRFAITAALPVARISETSVGYIPITLNTTQTQTAIGNPWLGVEATASPRLVLEIGVRPGVASEDKLEALGVGVVNDFDRFEAWLPQTSSGRVMAHIGRIPDQGVFATGILGGTVVRAGSSVGGGTTVYGNYGLRVGFKEAGLLTTATLTGRINVSDGNLSFSQRTVHQLAFNLELVRGRFRPYGSVGIFLDDDIRKQVSAIVSLGVALVLRPAP